MIFRPVIFLLLALFWMSSGGYAAEQKDNDVIEFFGASRPFLIHSDIISGGTFKALKTKSMELGYSIQGFPKYQRIYATYNLHIWETRMARSPAYARILNQHFKPYILKHPEKFSAETIADYSKGLTSRNPKTIEGIPLEWHHDGRHRFLLVEKGEHHSLSHVGGNKIWGNKYAQATTVKAPNLEVVWTARRWAKFSALEFIQSNLALIFSREQDYRTYAVNTFASAGSGFLAWSIESLTIKSFPLTIGTTSYFIKLPMNMGVLPINLGGPASWIASGIFILAKSAIMAGWKKYQLIEAWEIEKSCRYAEHMTFISNLKKAGHDNSKRLLQIIENN